MDGRQPSIEVRSCTYLRRVSLKCCVVIAWMQFILLTCILLPGWQ